MVMAPLALSGLAASKMRWATLPTIVGARFFVRFDRVAGGGFGCRAALTWRRLLIGVRPSRPAPAA
jgi:hypothetical protein